MSTDDPALPKLAANQSGITDSMAEAAALRGLYEALAEFSRVRASILAADAGVAQPDEGGELPQAA